MSKIEEYQTLCNAFSVAITRTKYCTVTLVKFNNTGVGKSSLAFANFNAGPIGFLAATPGTTALILLQLHFTNSKQAWLATGRVVLTGVYAFVQASLL